MEDAERRNSGGGKVTLDVKPDYSERKIAFSKMPGQKEIETWTTAD